MPIVSASRRVATYGPPASPTYSLPCWAISRAIRPAWHKEWLSEYSIERRAGVSSRLIGSPARGDVRDAAVVLVGATRIVGDRSIYIAPLAAAAVAMLAFLISLIGLPRMRELAPLDPAHQPGDLVQPYGH